MTRARALWVILMEMESPDPVLDVTDRWAAVEVFGGDDGVGWSPGISWNDDIHLLLLRWAHAAVPD